MLNNIHYGKIRSLTIAVLVWLGTIPVPLQAYDARVEEIISNPTVSYQKTFDVDATPEIWNRVLDNLYLMGRLWGIYRFQPAYQVTRTDSGLYVVDPTGIIGDVRQVGEIGPFPVFLRTGTVQPLGGAFLFYRRRCDPVRMHDGAKQAPGGGENLHAGKQLALKGRHEALFRHPHPSHRQPFHKQPGRYKENHPGYRRRTRQGEIRSCRSVAG